MLITQSFGEIEKSLDRYILVDVRSPAEFAENTITGAINIPLFNNEERAHVGTVYKREGKASAVKLGVDYVSAYLPKMYDSFVKLIAKQKKFLIFCARGGMRSEAVASFLSSIGFSVVRLEQGYKGYRQHITAKLPEMIESVDVITLYGNTGTGKTHILHEIKKMGHDILDLEACANHRGSTLGSVGLSEQHSQKKFETLIYDSLKNARSGRIFTEGESRKIGNVYIPSQLADKMDKGRKLLIEADLETRKKVIKTDYISASFDKSSAVEAINQLIRYIGKAKAAEYASLVEAGDYDTVIEELMVKYYDIVYNTSHATYEKTFFNTGAEKTAAEIIKYVSETIEV